MIRKVGRYLRRHHLALLALFLVLGGGTAYAAATLGPKNSVGSPQVINGSLQTLDLSKKARAALKGNRGPAGAQGTQGARGPTGPAGAPNPNAADSAKLEGKPGSAYRDVLRFEEDGPGALDPDADPTVCQTASYTSSGSETASIQGSVSLLAAGTMAASTHIVFSTNGGTTWSTANSWFTRDSGATGEWLGSTSLATLSLTAGTNYLFGVQVNRVSGTGDASDSRCNVTATIHDQ